MTGLPQLPILTAPTFLSKTHSFQLFIHKVTMFSQVKNLHLQVLAYSLIYLICKTGSPDFTVCTGHNLVLLLKSNMIDQIFQNTCLFHI